MKKHSMLIFIIVLLVISISYCYHIVIFYPPQSIHRWRQTDCTSITLNYYQHGMKFFKPEVHSLVSDDYTTGYAAGEAPILYYFMAIIYKILGPNDVIYRMINTLIFLIGLGALFRVCCYFIKDHFMAAFTVLLIFTSPVAVYYACNYLPDSTALSLVLLGWWQFLKCQSTKKYHRYLISVLLFTIAGLLKVSMSINLIALMGIVVLYQIKIIRLPDQFLLPKAFKIYVPVVFAVCLIGGWYLYAIWYNRLHQSITFLTGTRPWWGLNVSERKDITTFILDNNLALCFSRAFMYFLALCLFLVLIFRKKIPPLLAMISALLMIGGIVYVNLWYSQFQYHDYYFLTVLAPIAFLIIAAMVIIQSGNNRIFNSFLFRMALLVFLIMNVLHARQEMKLRYFGWKREAPVFEEYFTIKPYLRSIGIQPTDRVISIPDQTSCYTLYMMNQPGNTIANTNPATGDYIRKFIQLGAKYIFVNDTAYLKDSVLAEFIRIEVGHVQNVHIFRLDVPDINPVVNPVDD